MRRLALEQLEGRLMAGGLQPTDAEQLFLELLNDARANPAAYGQSIGLNLNGVAASMPLAFNMDIIEAARNHSEDMRDRNYFAHNTQGTNASPGDRMDAAGYDWTAWSESIAAGYTTSAAALRALIIDDGIPDLGHRKHLLAMTQLARSQTEVGIGIASGGGTYGFYYTIDSGRDFFTNQTHDVFLTGVIYGDVDNNNFYSLGEGYSGVTITATGPVTRSTMSFDSGGYSLELPDGTYQVTASGAGLATQTTNVTISGQNEKADFTTGSAQGEEDQDVLAVWNKVWRIDTNSNENWDGSGGGDTRYTRFGNTIHDIPAAIDWDGDGTASLGFMRRGKDFFVDVNDNGLWNKSIDRRIRIGDGNDQAIVGDFDGNGTDEFGTLDEQSGVFHVDTNGNHLLDNQDSQRTFLNTLATDRAIAGDWNGDGSDEIGIMRLTAGGRAVFLLDLNGNFRWDGSSRDLQVNLGKFDDPRPAVGNHDDDPLTEIAIFSNSKFHIDLDGNGTIDDTTLFAGGAHPVPGRWN